MEGDTDQPLVQVDDNFQVHHNDLQEELVQGQDDNNSEHMDMVLVQEVYRDLDPEEEQDRLQEADVRDQHFRMMVEEYDFLVENCADVRVFLDLKNDVKEITHL